MSNRRVIAQEERPAQEEPLHLKYRPKKLKEMFGQQAVVKSLQEVLASKNPGHSYLFTGPAGTGKTTLARILAAAFNCAPNSILEVDAATNNGIDAMRDITATLRYQGFGDTPNRALIIDECHALSKPAWQSLLKTVEEPPPHVYLFFCTTEQGKVPETILTRCHAYTLKPLKFDDLMTLLEGVVEDERLEVSDKVLNMVARAAGGSARQALVMLSMVRGIDDPEEAGRLLEAPLENKEVIDLCRMLVKGRVRWADVQNTIKALPEMNAESIRIVVVNYLASCALGARSEGEAAKMLNLMAPFSKPFNSTDKMAPLLLAMGDIVFGE